MQLPGPFRAAVGLAANAADEVKRLPDRAIELPMLAVSTVLQMSLRAQQRYARLTARGDEIIGGKPGDEPPAWATFDDPLAPEELGALADDGADAARLLDQLFGRNPGSAATQIDEEGDEGELVPPTPIRAARKSTARKTGGVAKKKAGSGSAAAKTSAKKAAPAPKAAGTQHGKQDHHDLPKAAGGKKVSKPRHTAPSKFDDADPDA